METVNQHGLIYTWPGSEEDLKPLLFMAHSDVGKKLTFLIDLTIPRLFRLGSRLPKDGHILHFQAIMMESTFGVVVLKTTSPI